MIKQIIIKIILKIISFIDAFEDSNDKLIYSHILDGVKVLSESGFSPASYIHKTKQFYIYTIKTENGLSLQCADEHIIYDYNMIGKWITDYHIGDKIKTINGNSKIISIEKSKTKVCMCDITVLNENESYYSNGILSHNTTTSAIFLLHYILFNVDKNSLVLGNKLRTAVEILDKIKKIFYEIPYFLKPGIYKWNEGEIVLDNGCRCMAEATTINSGISFTFHCVLADEFAHIHPNILDKFYNNLFPTITAGKARFIISSTQNGFNLFYRLYKGAEAGENEYAPFKVDWWQVPEWNPDKQCWEKRDEKWHKLQIANYGSEEAFNQQFGTNFDTKQNTLISSKFLRKMQISAVEYQEKELPGVTLSQYYFWSPDYEPLEDLRKSSIVITIDIAEGGGGDYTVFVFNKIIDETHFETIGYFRCNECDIKSCVVSLRQLCVMYMTPDKYAISIEQNLYGELFVKLLKEEIELHIDEVNLFNESILCKYWENSVKFSTTIKITHANKTRACIMLKNDLERGLLKNNSAAFVNEALNFCDTSGTGTYKAQYGHDDFMMAQTQLELAKDTYEVKNLIEGLLISNNTNTTYDLYSYDNAFNNDIYSMSLNSSGQDIYSMSARSDGTDIYSF